MDSTEFNKSRVEDFDRRFSHFYAANFAASCSQLGQDLLALFVLGESKNAYLDIGAADPSALSNTKLLERQGWDGVLVEPSPHYGAAILRERTATLIPKAVAPDLSDVAVLDLIEGDREVSRPGGHSPGDLNEVEVEAEPTNLRRSVETISVGDLLAVTKSKVGQVDFVSIDIRGPALPVLEKFPFSDVKPAVFCIKNDDPSPERGVEELFATSGYTRVCRAFSASDAWFVVNDALGRDDRQLFEVSSEAFVGQPRGQNIIDVARALYAQGAFAATAGLLENVRHDRSSDYVAMSLLARAYLHQANYANCLDVCQEAIAGLRAVDQPELGDKHFSSISDRALAKLNQARMGVEPRFSGSDLRDFVGITGLSDMRAALAEPHSLQANRAYVRQVCQALADAQRPLSMPAADDYVGRTELGYAGFTRLPQTTEIDSAGRVEIGEFGNVQRMFNGVKVPADAFYGSWMTELIRVCKGHHEPQEEYVFGEVLKTIPTASSMIELGSYWAFYTSWFLSEKGKSATATIVEPDPVNLAIGLESLRLNKATASAHLGYIASSMTIGNMPLGASGYQVPTFDIKSYVRRQERPVDILHADIQGAEDTLVSELSDSLKRGEVTNLFISTHGIRKHVKLLRMLSELDLYIICDIDPYESYSYDGLIVARHKTAPLLGYIDTARWKEK